MVYNSNACEVDISGNLYAYGAIREMVLWRLPKKVTDKPHGLKYRLYYGLGDGTCVVRYDNETPKGDHKHIGSQEKPYKFKNVETLVLDFLMDVKRAREK